MKVASLEGSSALKSCSNAGLGPSETNARLQWRAIERNETARRDTISKRPRVCWRRCAGASNRQYLPGMYAVGTRVRIRRYFSHNGRSDCVNA